MLDDPWGFRAELLMLDTASKRYVLAILQAAMFFSPSHSNCLARYLVDGLSRK